MDVPHADGLKPFEDQSPCPLQKHCKLTHQSYPRTFTYPLIDILNLYLRHHHSHCLKDFKPAPVKLDNLELLDGPYNYEDWAFQISMIFHAMGVYGIVDGLHPASDYSRILLYGENFCLF